MPEKGVLGLITVVTDRERGIEATFDGGTFNYGNSGTGLGVMPCIQRYGL